MCRRRNTLSGGDVITPIGIPGLKAVSDQPFFLPAISAGFPSPAENFVEAALDLNRHVVKHPVSTFYVRVQGNSMIDAGIVQDSILVVDRSIDCKDGDIVVARVNADFCIKRLRIFEGSVSLTSENPNYPAISITDETEFEIWGKVTWSIRAH